MDQPICILTEALVEGYRLHLLEQERSDNTIQKYLHAIRSLQRFLAGAPLSKSALISWKRCQAKTLSPASVNAMLAAVNGLLRHLDRADLCLRFLKIQRQIFCDEDRLLTQEEYFRLVHAAERLEDERFALALQTLCASGLRVSELQHITAESVKTGKAVVNCKNKTRVILLPGPLQKKLKAYLKKKGITAGPVFRTRTGRPLDRHYIWRRMKALCQAAGVAPGKVFPHNLRHLFARSFYSLERDIVRLADLLGHSSINTTRIYTLDSGASHLKCIQRLAGRLLTT